MALVLARKVGESICIGDNIRIVLVEIRGDKVRIGIDAPKEVPVHRQEMYEQIHGKAPAKPDSLTYSQWNKLDAQQKLDAIRQEPMEGDAD